MVNRTLQVLPHLKDRRPLSAREYDIRLRSFVAELHKYAQKNEEKARILENFTICMCI